MPGPNELPPVEEEDNLTEDPSLEEGADDGSQEIDLTPEEPEEELIPPKVNAAWAKLRTENKKLKQSIEEINQRMAQPPAPSYNPPPPTQQPINRMPQTPDEWDALAKQDWKQAVSLMSQVTYQNQQAAVRDTERLEKSKATVLERHPDLNDPNSEKYKIFNQIINENPQYLTDPKGPVHAMRDMEEHMETVLGRPRASIIAAKKQGVEEERLRTHRRDLMGGGGRTPDSGPGNKVTLTKEELEFCKHNRVDVKEYAKNKQMLGRTGKTVGVEK